MILAAVLVAGCNLFGDLTSDRVVGIIVSDSMRPVIIAPDTVQVGVTFTATVNTFGSSSCTDPDGVDLALSASLARIVPYDLVQTAGACTADFASRPHPVTIHFTQQGAATIRVVARMSRPTGPTTTDSLERALHVRP